MYYILRLVATKANIAKKLNPSKKYLTVPDIKVLMHSFFVHLDSSYLQFNYFYLI